jgi:DNA-binding NarL/FixJ family response regulator
VRRIKVLLAEDHETVRHGLRLLIDGQEDMRVVGEASDGLGAVERAAELKPHVVVLDIAMPKMNGLESARLLKERSPAAAIVALTRHDDDAYVAELLRAGASAYVLKQSASNELLRAIRAAARGQQYLDPALAARATQGPPSHIATDRNPITEREAEVLRLMAVGHTNKEIAERLGLAVKTVEVHKANAARKLGFRGRIDFIKYALLQGWLRDP